MTAFSLGDSCVQVETRSGIGKLPQWLFSQVGCKGQLISPGLTGITHVQPAGWGPRSAARPDAGLIQRHSSPFLLTQALIVFTQGIQKKSITAAHREQNSCRAEGSGQILKQNFCSAILDRPSPLHELHYICYIICYICYKDHYQSPGATFTVTSNRTSRCSNCV